MVRSPLASSAMRILDSDCRSRPSVSNRMASWPPATDRKPLEKKSVSAAESRFYHNFARIRVHATNPPRKARAQTISLEPGSCEAPNRPQHSRQQSDYFQSYDQKLSQSLFEKREVGQMASGVNFEATASDLPSDEDIMGKAGVRYFSYGFRWVQTVVTNDPLPGQPKESIDGEGRNGAEPFYSKYVRNEKGPGKFEDWPARQLSPNQTSLEWKATLALVGVETENKWMEPYDIRTYGFTLTPDMSLTQQGQQPYHKVNPIYPKEDWSAFARHRSIVQAAVPSWGYSLLKAKAGAAKGWFMRQTTSSLEASKQKKIAT